MVQRKTPNKLASQTEPVKNHVKPEKHNPSHLQQQQDKRSRGGGGDLNMQMKKVRPIKPLGLEGFKGTAAGDKESPSNEPPPPRRLSLTKASDGSPNYMKPTSSSDARKEKLQVTLQPQAATNKIKNRCPRNSTNLNNSKPSTTSSYSGLKHIKILTKKSSFRLVRSPSMKKTSDLALCPIQNLNNPTCSSTLKDSKFPKYLDLNPGGTEADGMSALRVCPYNYCSLNGHWHAPLPPLRDFISERRNLIKTQKSFKLKGHPSFRVKDAKKLDTGQEGIARVPSGLQISPLIEEVVNDFFVEIYAKPKEQTKDFGNSKEIEYLQILNRMSGTEDNGPSVKRGDKEDEKTGLLDQMDETEIYPDVVLDDDIDQKSEISTEEMDALTEFLEHVECDQRVKVEGENHPSLMPQDYTEWCDECCVFDVLGNEDKGLTDGGIKMSTPADARSNWGEELAANVDISTNYTEHSDDVLGPISICLQGKINGNDELFSEPNITSSETKSEQFLGNYEENVKNINTDNCSSEGFNDASSVGREISGVDNPSICNGKATEISDSVVENRSVDVGLQDFKMSPLESSDENGRDDGLIKEENEAVSSEENVLDSSYVGCNEKSFEDQGEASEIKGDIPNQDIGAIHIFNGEMFEHAYPETENKDEEILDKTILVRITNGEDTREDGVNTNSSLFIHLISEHYESSTVTDKHMELDDHIQIELELEDCKHDEVAEGPSSNPETHIPSGRQSDESETAQNRTWRKKEQELEEISEAKEKISQAADNDSIVIDGIEYDVEHVADSTCLLSISESSNENKTVRTARPKFNRPLTDASDEPKLRLRITRKNRTEEPEVIKEFNPRSPRFLPLEPDPEAEKVDLRHQMIDDRKNAEEWMLDYALQRAVSKLAPARKKKVELLVEAFETVAPRSRFEEPIRHATSAFDLSRPIQACS